MNSGKLIKETHDHIFSDCPNANKIKKDFQEEFLILTLNTSNQKFPWWMSQFPKWDQNNHLKLKIDPNLGDRGFFPKGLNTIIEKITKKPITQALLQNISKLLAKHVCNIWKNRNDYKFKGNLLT